MPRSPSGGAYWNIKTSAGELLAKWFPHRPSHKNGMLKEGQSMVGGGENGYRSEMAAITRERSDKYYPHLFRRALERGYQDRWGKVQKPTQTEVCEWTALSRHSMRAWMRPTTIASHRSMPRYAIRLILHEFALRDHSSFDWKVQLRHCQ